MGLALVVLVTDFDNLSGGGLVEALTESDCVSVSVSYGNC